MTKIPILQTENRRVAEFWSFEFGILDLFVIWVLWFVILALFTKSLVIEHFYHSESIIQNLLFRQVLKPVGRTKCVYVQTIV